MRILHLGLGPIGRLIATRALRRPGLELVGAVDSAEAMAGHDLGEVLNQGTLGLTVQPSLEQAIDRARPDLVVQATGSSLADVAPQLRLLLDRGISVLSTCEELAFPFVEHAELARELDAKARAAGAVLLGSGVNPGFVMDKLVVTLMGACSQVRAVKVARVVDAATRRLPFQKKVGAGLALAEFEERRHAGTVGHVGLVQSAHMLAHVLCVPRPYRVEQTLRPVLAEEPGRVAGVEQSAAIESDGVEQVRLDLHMALGAAQPRDSVAIDGSPPLAMTITTGVAGDEGTAAVVVNCIPLVPELRAGLRTMLDVPLRFTARAAHERH